MTSTALTIAGELTAPTDRGIALPRHPALPWPRRLVARLWLHLALWHVRAELATLPGFVLRDIDVERAVHSAARVLARRRRMGGRQWTS